MHAVCQEDNEKMFDTNYDVNLAMFQYIPHLWGWDCQAQQQYYLIDQYEAFYLGSTGHP